MEKIDISAIVNEMCEVHPQRDIFTTSRKVFKDVVTEAVRQALEAVLKKASIDRYFPDPKDEDGPRRLHEDNYEATYRLPYKEDSSCHITLNPASVRDIINLVE